MLTSLDVIDSAVKIGLGTLIGIVGTLWAARQRHSQELAKDRLRRRQDALEHFAEDFESIYADLLAAYTEFALLCRYHDAKNEKWQEKHMKIAETLPSLSKGAIRTLHGIEGRLRLFGLKDSAAALQRFREAFGRLSTMALAGEPATEAEISKQFRVMMSERTQIYDLLAAAHRGDTTT